MGESGAPGIETAIQISLELFALRLEKVGTFPRHQLGQIVERRIQQFAPSGAFAVELSRVRDADDRVDFGTDRNQLRLDPRNLRYATCV